MKRSGQRKRKLKLLPVEERMNSQTILSKTKQVMYKNKPVKWRTYSKVKEFSKLYAKNYSERKKEKKNKIKKKYKIKLNKP